MTVKLREIKDLMVEKVINDSMSQCGESSYSRGQIDGYNQCQYDQGSRSLGLNRENLRLLLVSEIAQLVCDWEMRPRFGEGSDKSDLIIKLADAIISKESELIEYCPARHNQ